MRHDLVAAQSGRGHAQNIQDKDLGTAAGRSSERARGALGVGGNGAAPSLG